MSIHLKLAIAVFLLTVFLSSIADQPEFESVQQVYEFLKDEEGVDIRTEQGWTIAEKQEDMALWSFTTDGHPAHPSVFMRQVVISEERIILRTWGICEAEKDACDALSREFEELNESVREQMGISDA